MFEIQEYYPVADRWYLVGFAGTKSQAITECYWLHSKTGHAYRVVNNGVIEVFQ